MYVLDKIIERLLYIQKIFENEGYKNYSSSIETCKSYIIFLKSVNGEEFLEEEDPDYIVLVEVLNAIKEFIKVTDVILHGEGESYD